MFIDDTCSFGVLGKGGRGVTEHYNIPIDDIDMVSATLENSMAAYGGFCCGTSFIVDHQRLSGLGYCFSASLPPLQAAVALSSLDTIEKDPSIIENLRQNAEYMHGLLKAYVYFYHFDILIWGGERKGLAPGSNTIKSIPSVFLFKMIIIICLLLRGVIK